MNARPPVGQAAHLLAEIERLKADIAKAQRTIAELEARAELDPLLDVLNRRGFERELKRSLAYLQRYKGEAALLFIDLDGFKAINDRHGHAAGDVLLKAAAAELSRHVRASDMVARLGGDEFGVLLWNLGPPQAAAKARELENLIAAVAVSHGEAVLSVGASAGYAPLDSVATPAQMIDAADKAMYARKRERRGRCLNRACDHFALVSGVCGLEPGWPGAGVLLEGAMAPAPVVAALLPEFVAAGTLPLCTFSWAGVFAGLSSACAIVAPASRAATAATVIKAFIRFLRWCSGVDRHAGTNRPRYEMFRAAEHITVME
jgi:diguanylate cyclase (GGDEF)-like protein